MKSFTILFLMLLSFNVYSGIEDTCKDTWIYFDLGNTLVNTKDHPNQVKYMEGALEYLDSLKNAGCTLGLIVNIPEQFGTSYQEKLSTLKKYVEDRWVEDTPFVWEYFSEIYLPKTNEDLKPKPILFQQVMRNAWKAGKKVFYQGETPKEIDAAKKEGMTAHLVGSRSDSFYLPVDEI
ncbi:MAG: hypothetical protein EP326_14860 [Deltaproteobacteria bacterium]|nr:MAG: hypothetical protein EP326_14860 [Deltaproteobacteria bacterium]TNF25588.1 MAG: hypothetical protein EP319_15825 [Deltaproteobacteria bacterium]